MSRFIKISLGFAIFFAVLGICALVIAFAMGLNWKELKNMAKEGELTIIKGDSWEQDSILDYESCNSLDIEFSAGTLMVYYDDVAEIKVEQDGVKDFNCRYDGNTLRIQGGRKALLNNSKGNITVIVPKGFVFKEVDMEIGAGQANVENLCAEEFDIEVGAGQANLENIDVKYLKAKTGAGQIDANLVGSQGDYKYDLECGIGEIQIGGSSYGGFGRETTIENPGAQRELDVECGVGQIVIEFQE